MKKRTVAFDPLDFAKRYNEVTLKYRNLTWELLPVLGKTKAERWVKLGQRARESLYALEDVFPVCILEEHIELLAPWKK